MACDTYREALSARADGEDPGIDALVLDAHVAACAECRRYAEQIDSIGRATRVGPTPVMPDLSRRVVKLNAIADRTSRRGVVRALLALVAIEVIALSLPALILGEETSASAHAARHLGAFSVAYGVGLLVVVARPARARTMLPVAMVLAGALLVTAVVDAAQGRVPLVGEAGHLPEVLSVVLVWLLARPAPRRSGSVADADRTGRRLRLIDDAEPSRGTG